MNAIKPAPAAYATGKQRKTTNEATEATARKLAMVVELLTQRRISFSAYAATFGLEFRSFQRDLQQLRKIGTTHGFQVTPIKNGEYVELVALDGKVRVLNRDAKRLERLLATMAQALGEPMVREIGTMAAPNAERDDFFSFTAPQLVEGNSVADICTTLREAHGSPSGRAAVRFLYPERGKTTMSERVVEPYGVTVRSGSFYLIGYDRGSKGWRMFAIDRFGSKPVRAGTCSITRAIPAQYASNDVLGFIKGQGRRVDVTVELSARVAASATARRWQTDQRVEKLEDGRAQMTFAVSDIDEVVRWSLGFGIDAYVVSPPEAKRRAAELTSQIAARYHD